MVPEDLLWYTFIRLVLVGMCQHQIADVNWAVCGQVWGRIWAPVVLFKTSGSEIEYSKYCPHFMVVPEDLLWYTIISHVLVGTCHRQNAGINWAVRGQIRVLLIVDGTCEVGGETHFATLWILAIFYHRWILVLCNICVGSSDGNDCAKCRELRKGVLLGCEL